MLDIIDDIKLWGLIGILKVLKVMIKINDWIKGVYNAITK